jgi:hypothetical protein
MHIKANWMDASLSFETSYIPASLHGAVSQKTAFIITAVITWNHIDLLEFTIFPHGSFPSTLVLYNFYMFYWLKIQQNHFTTVIAKIETKFHQASSLLVQIFISCLLPYNTCSDNRAYLLPYILQTSASYKKIK